MNRLEIDVIVLERMNELQKQATQRRLIRRCLVDKKKKRHSFLGILMTYFQR